MVHRDKGASCFAPSVPKVGKKVKRDSATGKLEGSGFAFCLNKAQLIKWIETVITSRSVPTSCFTSPRDYRWESRRRSGWCNFSASSPSSSSTVAFSASNASTSRTRAFRFTTRYIDDILAMANKFIEHLLSARDVYEGVQGIYRECLVLTTEQEKTDGEVTYLDLEIYKHTDLNHHTTVYNKKLHPPLDKIKHISYPHIESFISRTAKYGVMSSQLVRYARLCSRKESFVFHTRALLTTLLEKQYRFEKLSHTVRAFIFKHPYLFACRSPEGLAPSPSPALRDSTRRSTRAGAR